MAAAMRRTSPVLLFFQCSLGEVMVRPDLGRHVTLGTLYDAVRDAPLHSQLWPKSLLEHSSLVETVPADHSQFQMTKSENLEERAKLQDIEVEVTVAIAGGFVSVGGSARFLKEKHSSRYTASVVANYHVQTQRRALNVNDPRLCRERLEAPPELQHATHLVTNVVYGADVTGIFSKETSSSIAKDLEVMRIWGEIDFWLVTVREDLHNEYEYSESSFLGRDISVQIFGDVLPPNDLNLTDARSALRYMLMLPTMVQEFGDVPKQLVLTPLAELPSCLQSRRLAVPEFHHWTLPTSFNLLSLDMFQQLGRSEQCFKRLTELYHHGFPSLVSTVKCYLQSLQDYTLALGTRINEAMQDYRASGSDYVLDDLVQTFYDDGYSWPDMEAVCDGLHTQFATAADLASTLQELAGIKMASKPSAFFKSTTDPEIDLVYMLLFVGPPDSIRNRESLHKLQDFVRISQTMTDSGDLSEAKCHKSLAGMGCYKHVAFTALQFDTYCQHFCPSQYCQRQCHDATCVEEPHSEAVRPHLPDHWCQQPYTLMLSSANSAEPVPLLQALRQPKVPQVANVVFNVTTQQIQIHLAESQDCGQALHYAVQVSWQAMSGQSQQAYQLEYETHPGARPPHTVRVAFDVGRGYKFSVATVNAAGRGPFSARRSLPRMRDGRRLAASDDLESLPIPVVGVRSTREALLSLPPTNVNRVPGWRCFPITIALSSDAFEQISSVTFFDSDHSFKCLQRSIDRLLSRSTWHCNMPAFELAADRLWQFNVTGVSGRLVAAPGALLQEAPSIESCQEWEQAYYCHSIVKSCVSSCGECAARQHAVGLVPVCNRSHGSDEDAPSAYWEPFKGPATISPGQSFGSNSTISNSEVCSKSIKYWEDDLQTSSSRGRHMSGLDAPAARMEIDITIVPGEQIESCRDHVETDIPQSSPACTMFVPRQQASAIQQLIASFSNEAIGLTAEVWLDVPEASKFVQSNTSWQLGKV